MKSTIWQELKKQGLASRARKPTPSPEEAAASQQDNLSDEELFQKAARGTQRLASPSTPFTARKPPSRPSDATLRRRAVAQGPEDSASAEAISDHSALLNPVSPDAYIEFCRPGVRLAQFKRLRQGQLPWQATLDLHGCTMEQARGAVMEIVQQAQAEELTVLRIVHGKGRQGESARLKTCVNGWLRQLSNVLAFCSAQPKEGGTGAVYVLVKKPRGVES